MADKYFRYPTICHGLGDAICFVSACRRVARSDSNAKCHFNPRHQGGNRQDLLKQIFEEFGDGLVDVTDTVGSVILEGNAHSIHRQGPASEFKNFVGTYVGALGSPVNDRPCVEIPVVNCKIDLPKTYLAFQPMPQSAPKPSRILVQMIIDSFRNARQPIEIVVIGKNEESHGGINFEGLSTKFMGEDWRRFTYIIKNSIGVICPRSSAAHFAAGFHKPSLVYLPNDGENWHIDYPEWLVEKFFYHDPEQYIQERIRSFANGIRALEI